MFQYKMKKILYVLSLMLIACASANAQFKYKIGLYVYFDGRDLRIDSARNAVFSDTMATRKYMRSWVANFGGGSGQVDSLSNISYRPFSALQNIPTTVAGYGITDAVTTSRNINTGIGLLGGGDLSADRTLKSDTSHGSSGITTYLYTRKITDSLVNLISASGGGTVLSVARTNGYGISASVASPTVNPNITIGIDSATLFITALRRKDSVDGGYYPYSTNPKSYLVSADVSSAYVPLTRTVNGKALSSNVTLGLASADFANQGTTSTVLIGNGSGNPSFGQVTNNQVSSSAAIVYSKLNLTGAVVNADVSASAAIVYSKLNLTGSILNGDIVNGTIDLGSKVTGSLPATRLAGSLTVALTDGATISTDASLGFVFGSTFTVTLGGSRTLANPTNLTDGQRMVFRLKQDGTGSRTITWGSKYRFSTDIPSPTLSTIANYVDYVAFIYNLTDDKLDVVGVNIGVH
jgi:hypothetical protein